MDTCSCPRPSELTTIPQSNCKVNLKQIQRIAFQRSGTSFDESTNSILELASWQAKTTATDDTKIVLTPIIGANPTIQAGEPIKQGGGDNSTLNGVEEVTGVNPSKFTAEFLGLSAETEKALKKLMCEKDLTVYFFLQGGGIASRKIDAQKHAGFTIQSTFISDRGNEGFGTDDKVKIEFSLLAGWSDDLDKLQLNFNPLTEL